MEWLSPWGPGAPGWHLECSVMSMKYLGSQFDIHTGGIDHREIHHCNEIAQNQAFTHSGASGANFWMHNNFLVDRGGKMSKSKGGFATLASVIEKGVHPLAYRFVLPRRRIIVPNSAPPEALVAALTRLAAAGDRGRTGPRPGGHPEWLRLVAEKAPRAKGENCFYQRTTIESGLDAKGAGVAHPA